MAFNMTLDTGSVWPPLPTLAELKLKQTKRVDFVTSVAIRAGFDHTIDGVTYHFSYDTSDQSNFSDQAISALSCLEVSGRSMESLIAQYGALEDGTLDTSKLPAELSDTWRAAWRGHIGEQSFTLVMDVHGFIELMKAAAAHKTNTLGLGWQRKAMIEAAADEAALDEVVHQLDLDNLERLAKEKYKILEVTF